MSRSRHDKRSSAMTRRQFLRGLGGIAVGLPLLASQLSTSPARAQATTPEGFPRRFLVFYTPNGVMPDAWWPTAGANEREFELASSLQPLAPYKSRMMMLRGVDYRTASYGPGGPHQKGMGTALTGRLLQQGSFVGGDGSLAGWADGVSVDQVIAGHIGSTNRLKSLELGIRADNGGAEVRSRLSYAGPGMPLPPLNDPQAVFDTLFSDFQTDPDALGELRARRLSVLDAVRDQFDHVHKRAGYEDRQRLEAHRAMIRDLELRLQNSVDLDGACHVPDRPEAMTVDDETTMPEIAALQTELMALAMVCDITRVGSIQFSNAMNHIRYPWLESYGDGHSLSHAGPSNSGAFTEWVARDQWHASQIAALCATLDGLPEGSGSMLDNTCVMWINELSQGNIHSLTDIPYVLIGSAGGALDTGRFVQVQDVPHNNLLTALQQAYGIEAETFGDPEHCTGVMSEILA